MIIDYDEKLFSFSGSVLSYVFLSWFIRSQQARDFGKNGDKGSPDLGAAQTIDVEVESKVEELQVVGHRPEHLETEVLVKFLRKEERENSCRCGAADKENDNGNKNNDEHSLLRTL